MSDYCSPAKGPKKKRKKKSNIIDTYLPKNTAELNTEDSHSLFYNFGDPSIDKK